MKNNAKTIITVTILTLVIIISGIITLMYLSSSAGKLQKNIDAASEAVSSKQWPEAGKYLDEFGHKWETTKFSWAILLDHFEIDNIDNSYTKSIKYIESEDYPSALAELEALKHYIEHIPIKERFSLENILRII